MTCALARLSAGLLAAAALLLALPRAYARPVPFDLDSQAFRFILWQASLSPQTSLGDLDQDPARSLLIVFGDTRQLDQPASARWLRSFLERGGAVLIATDRGAPQSRAWEKELGVRINGRLIEASEPASMYREAAADCPLLRPLRPFAAMSLPVPPISLPVATNKPSYLEVHTTQFTPFLGFPADCHVAGSPLPLGLFLPFGVGGTLGRGQGRVLVLADHSIFINLMMLQTDNGNFDFAYACVQWLLQSGPLGRKRDRAMFLDEGTVFDTFEVPMTLEPDAGPSPVELANQLIGQIEQEDLLNRLILRHITLPGVFRGLVMAGTVLLLVYGLYRLIRAGYRPESRVPLVSRRVAQLVTAPAVVDQRHQALLRQGNLWEAARDLARACFTSLDISLAPAPTRGGGFFTALPRVRSDTDWRQRRALRQTVYQLWRLASSPRPRRISRRRFTQLVNQVEVVKAAVHNGTLRITGPRETP